MFEKEKAITFEKSTVFPCFLSRTL